MHMTTRAAWFAGILCSSFLALTPHAVGAPDPLLNQQQGRIKKTHVDSVVGVSAPKAQLAAMTAKLNEMDKLLLATPVIREMRGFDITTSTSIKPHHHANRPFVAGTLLISYPFVRMGKDGVPVSSEEGAPFRIHVNEPEAIFVQGRYTLDPVTGFVTEPKLTGHLDGFPVYDKEYVVISRRDVPMFLPVSRERYLTNEIESARKALDHAGEATKGMPKKLPAGEDDLDIQRRGLEREREKLEKRWASMQEKWPDKVARERAQYEERVQKQMRTINEQSGKSPRDRYLQPFQDRLKAFEDELASMSAAERAEDTYFAEKWNKQRASGMAPSGSSDGRRVVTINPAIFDPAKPKTAVQLIILGTPKYRNALFEAAQQQIDKQALLALCE